MKSKTIEIFNQEAKINNDKYNFIIKEKWIEGWGKSHSCGRTRPKFYLIKKNGRTILITSLHQVFYARKNKIVKGAI